MAKSLGILTGGGDCPGLNAVIRAVVRRADAAGWDVVAVREGWRGLVEPIFEELGPQQVSGILPRGGTIIGTSRTNPFTLEGGVERCSRTSATVSSTRSSPSAARTRSASRRGSSPSISSAGRRPEDDRQRSLRHRLHVRLRHRRVHRDRGDRPSAYDRGVAQPRHGRRGDGPPDRLDRGDERHRRRRRRDPRARDPGRFEEVCGGDQEAARARQELLHRRRQRGLRAAGARRRAARRISSAT